MTDQSDQEAAGIQCHSQQIIFPALRSLWIHMDADRSLGDDMEGQQIPQNGRVYLVFLHDSVSVFTSLFAAYRFPAPDSSHKGKGFSTC